MNLNSDELPKACSADCSRDPERVAANDSDRHGRRDFLKAAAISFTSVTFADVFGQAALAQVAGERTNLATYPRKKIATLDNLAVDAPIAFDYPEQGMHSNCMLVRLNRPAGGGVGEKQDIVAFSTRCTHMGGDMSSGYVAEHQLIGCGEHLTTFDLTRHGIVVAGHATQSLPQVVLEVEGDSVFATGIVGLLYGHHENPGRKT